jgi:hypothetical protein
MSETGALFATNPNRAHHKEENDDDDDDDHALNQEVDTQLFFRSFDLDRFSNWKFTVPKEEEVLAVACAREFCCVATSRGHLRVFRFSGLQEQVIQLPSSKILCMVGNDSRLLIFYANSAHNTSSVKYQVWEFGQEGKSK